MHRAWSVAAECLNSGGGAATTNSSAQQIQFYGATIFREKINLYFSQLPASEYGNVRNTLFGLLAKSYPPLVSQPLASALSLLAAKIPATTTSPGGVTSLVADCLKLAPNRPAIALQILSLLPEQVEGLSPTPREHGYSELKAARESVIQFIRVCLTPPGADSKTPASPAPSGGTAPPKSPAQLIQQTITSLASPVTTGSGGGSGSGGSPANASAAAAAGRDRLFEFYDSAVNCLLCWMALPISVGDLSRWQVIAPLMQIFTALHPKCTPKIAEIIEKALEVEEESAQLHNV